MAEAERYVDHAEAQREKADARAHESGPRERADQGGKDGAERDPDHPGTSLNEDIRARINRPHKGDEGNPSTNEEIYQGSKMKELT